MRDFRSQVAVNIVSLSRPASEPYGDNHLVAWSWGELTLQLLLLHQTKDDYLRIGAW
jgi:hypothetical protein